MNGGGGGGQHAACMCTHIKVRTRRRVEGGGVVESREGRMPAACLATTAPK